MGLMLLGLSVLLLYLLQMRKLKDINQISTQTLHSRMEEKDTQFIDVRTAGEFSNRSIKGFKNLPLNELLRESKKVLDPNREVIVICQSGMRSVRASKQLKQLGFREVTNVKGGMGAWRY